MIPQANVDCLWNVVVNPRLGVGYVFGGSFSPDDTSQGSDCSGATGTELSALVNGPDGIDWDRGNRGSFSTFTFAGANPGDTGPFGGAPVTAPLICIAEPTDAPPDAVMIIAVNQQGDGHEAHMISRVQGIDIEMGGNEFTPSGVELDYHTSQTNPNSNSVMDTDSFNQWFYLPGPIGGDGPPPPPPPPAPAGQTYTVQSGDSLSDIANRFQVTLEALEAANPGITDPNEIWPGQVIQIP